MAAGQGQAIRGAIAGDQSASYLVDARAGQQFDIVLEVAGRASLYHNIIAPSGATVFVGSMEGRRFHGALREAGRYRIQVYLMRNDARRGTRAAFTLHVRDAGAGGEGIAGTPSFDCRKSNRGVETVICTSPHLAELDARLAFVYRDAIDGASAARAEAIRRDQRAWLRQRDTCERERDAAACLDRRYSARIGQLEPKR